MSRPMHKIPLKPVSDQGWIKYPSFSLEKLVISNRALTCKSDWHLCCRDKNGNLKKFSRLIQKTSAITFSLIVRSTGLKCTIWNRTPQSWNLCSLEITCTVPLTFVAKFSKQFARANVLANAYFLLLCLISGKLL